MEYAAKVDKGAQAVNTADRVQSTLQSLLITTFLTPITTQSYMPIIPLLLTSDFSEPITRVGQLFFTLAFGSSISFILMGPLLSRFKTRHVLMADFFVRTGAGLIWVYAVQSAMNAAAENDAPAAPLSGPLGTVPLLFLSRFMFGLTLK